MNSARLNLIATCFRKRVVPQEDRGEFLSHWEENGREYEVETSLPEFNKRGLELGTLSLKISSVYSPCGELIGLEYVCKDVLDQATDYILVVPS